MPRQRLRQVAVAIAAVLLIAAFTIAGFPYDRVALRLTAAIERESGYAMQLENLGPSLSLRGPAISAGPLRVAHPEGGRLEFERATLRPAWSSWLRGKPAVHLTLHGPDLAAEGIVQLGEAPAFLGTLREVDLARLPLTLSPGAELAGRARADVELAFALRGPVGPVHLVARDGSLAHPLLPLQVPYEELSGDLRFGGEHWLSIQELDVRSPLVTGQVSGTIGEPPQWALDLELEFVPNDSVRTALAIQGVPVGQNGQVSVHVEGTATHPVVR